MSTVAGLRLTIRRFLAREITFNNLSNVVRSDGKRSLPVTSLSLADVQKVLGLNLILDDEFDHIPPVPLPSGLELWFEKSDRTVGSSLENEASIRVKLNLLLIAAHDHVTSCPDPAANTFTIQMEPTWSYTNVEWNDSTWTLSGRPDYSIWYGQSEDLDLNVIVMEAKRVISGIVCVPQCLAYMGMVHKQRQEQRKQDCTVYGISTDVVSFTFLKLDNDAKWSMKSVQTAEKEFEKVFGILVYLLRKAAAMSPAPSNRASRHTQEGSGNSSLIRQHSQEEDFQMDFE